MLTFAQRANLSQNTTAKKLFSLIAKKETNLAVSLDVTTKKEFLQLAEAVGPEICLLKTHIDIIEDFDTDLVQQLTALAHQYDFLIFEDRKFADIGNTVKLQYEKGIYHIAEWAPITNAHPILGEGIIQGLKEVGLPRGNALLLLAQLSSQGNLIDPKYTQTAVALAKQHADFVIGFISQEKLTDDPSFLHLCPGVHMAAATDTQGQQYKSPEQAIVNGNDIIIVGRGIYGAKDPVAAAQRYRAAGWTAITRLQNNLSKL